MKVSNSLALSAAVAGLVAGSASLVTSPAAFAASGKVDCYNSCQGKSACGGKKMPTSSSCSGQLKFKKQMTAAQCEKKGGTTTKGGSSAAPAAGSEAPTKAPDAAAPAGEAPKQ